MDERVAAGAALLAAGYPQAARRALGDTDDALARGVRSVADALDAAERGAWAAVEESANEAVTAFEAAERQEAVALETLAAFAAAVAADPETVERRAPPALRDGGESVTLDALDADAALRAGEALAAARDDDDLEAGFAYAREDLDAGESGSEFVRLGLDALQGPAGKMPAERLRQHAARRRQREADVAGLFD